MYQISKFSNKTAKYEPICYRRYKHFTRLYLKIKSNYSSYILPAIPKRNIFKKYQNDPVFYEERRRQLEIYLNYLHEHNILSKKEEFKKFMVNEEFVRLNT